MPERDDLSTLLAELRDVPRGLVYVKLELIAVIEALNELRAEGTHFEPDCIGCQPLLERLDALEARLREFLRG